MKISFLQTAALVALAVVASTAASQAQISAGKGLGPLNKPTSQPKAAPPPDALPGAITDKDRVAPADKVVTDLAPNDALFDGINRGDIATVRDAINRGADLSARSVLGQSPLELSVDLGRNDVTFLLLSLRGSDGGSAGRRPPTPQTKEARAKADRATAAELRAAQAMQDKADRAKLRSTAVAAREPAQRATPGSTAQQYAGNGGAPVPAAGFLGFGSSAR